MKNAGIGMGLVVMFSVGAVYAQSYTVTPRSPVFGGGYNISSQNGLSGTISPRSPVFGGGYDVHYNNGRSGTITPRSPVFGGGYDCNFRGANGENLLFEKEEFSQRFSVDAWVGAVESRDVSAMAQLAWNLKAVEAVLGKQDKKTTSDAMFKAAAQLAVEQRNETALAEIVALCPTCKTYQDELKAGSATRGTASVITMPQIVYPVLGPLDPGKPGDFKKQADEMAHSLARWQTPYLTPDLVRFNFRGMSTPEAENVATLANQGRQTGNAGMLAQSAVALVGQSPSTECTYLKPERLLDEAAGMALAFGDKKSLAQVINIYENDVFGLKDQDKAKALAEEFKMLSNSRGKAELSEGVLGRIMKPKYILIFDPPTPPELSTGIK